ncbi:hypothetical protein ZYGR_0H04880 [Zygosaccharomyces rouxii]|uniref:Maintenance of telomere capping protein 6 n=1 Tax=Zygosaccharomyces rouxii TaxID=4956 RepID=A0A1Q2ZVU8_ZYGRO|nr:hypothetical protein ZYGR_0H04880 [Zygosaccharomyces rouxii]
MNGLLLILLVYITVWRPRPCQCIQERDIQRDVEDLPSVSYQVQYGIRSQRDLMANVPIDQVPMIGVNIFDAFLKNGRNNDSRALLSFMELMQHGVQSFTVDLEPRNSQWMLKKSNISFTRFLNVFQTYVNGSDNNLSANMLVLLLKISPGNESNSTGTGKNGSNLTRILDQSLGRQRIYTPDDLDYDREYGRTFSTFGANSVGWPILGSFLYDKKRRVILMEVTNHLVYQNTPYIFNGSSILHLDEGNATLGIPTTVDQIQNLSSISWKFLEASFTTTDIKQYVDIGYNPVITNEYSVGDFGDIYQLLNLTILWSWKPDQPKTIQSSDSAREHQLIAYNCAALHYTSANFSASWDVENCYAIHKGLCKHRFNDYIWVISKGHDNYFGFDSHSESKCPEDYYFSLPKTPLEQLAITQYLRNTSSEDALFWIDMNSVSVNDCWVTGGPDATCPYQRSVSKRNFVAMLTPVTVCSFVILCVVFYLNVLHVPIHNNRKSWRRIITEVSKWEVDGVPS